MKIKILLRDNQTRIGLWDGKKEIDRGEIGDPRVLSEQLLPEIDKLLRRNKLEPSDIQKVETESDLPDSYTSTRIIEAVAKGMNFKG